MAKNSVLDRGFQGISAAALVGLAYQDLISKYIHAIYPLNYALGGIAIVFILYCVLAPLFRR
jgi:hypothetical protein